MSWSALVAGGAVGLALVLVGCGAGRRPPRRPLRSEAACRRSRLPLPRRVGAALAAAFPGTPPERAAIGALAVAAALVAVSARLGPVPAAVGLVAGTGGVVVVVTARRGERTRRVVAALPELVEGTARSLRAGASLPGAALEAGAAVGGPLADDLAAVAAALARGRTFGEALEGWGAARASHEVELVGAALAGAHGTGGAQARALDGVAATLRDHAAVAREVRALASQATASAVLLTAAPVVVTAISASLSPEVGRFLLQSPAGQACLVLGLALDALGGWWMLRIVRRA